MTDSQEPRLLGKDDVRASAVLRAQLEELWHELRPALFRHCLGLCGNALDAEDLVQESFAKALTRLGEQHAGVAAPKAYFFRIATNTWLDELRRHRPELLPELAEIESSAESCRSEEPSAGLELSESCAELLRIEDPRARAALLLCDAFGFDGPSAGSMLGISPGHVRVLRHRARKQLQAAREELQARPQRHGSAKPMGAPRSTPLLERFVQAFRERDVAALLEINAVVTAHDILGIFGGVGDDVAKGIYEHTFEDASLRSASLVGYRGETLVALWYDADGQRVLRDLLRVETSGAKIARVRYYYFCPEVLQAVGHELGIPVRTQGYCYPRP